MENSITPDLKFTEEQLSYLLENIEKLPLFLSEEEIKNLVATLKSDLSKIDGVIEKLQELETDKKVSEDKLEQINS
jgi:long-subunit acyl-CoA synthetase (AMP-forming)